MFHGARILAEEYLGVTFDEFVGFSPAGNNNPSDGYEGLLYDEEFCRHTLDVHKKYLDLVGVALEGDDVPMPSFDEEARAWAESVVKEWDDEVPLFKRSTETGDAD
jgi:hypothetical protein